ncbi:MAG: methyltransferase [Flavobacteriales bacterium]|nr:methyltransferase [Flavobacteriales bacterium]
MPSDPFQFKQFSIHQDRCALKVGTDSVVLGAWTNVEGAKRILDIGTGTGVLALMAAQRTSDAHVDAVEIDDASAGQAAENVAGSPWSGRMRVHRLDVRRMSASEPYDLILCNPPFYAGEMDSPDARKGLAKHSGELSFEELIEAVRKLLADEGRFTCIIPLNREEELVELAEGAWLGLERRCVLHYLEGRPPKRVLLEFVRGGGAAEKEELTVERAPGQFTEGYRALLKDFMLKF